MHNLSQNLYVTYANQRVRDIKANLGIKPLDKVMTLDELILQKFEKNSFKTIIDENLGTSLIYKIIQEEGVAYFSYLQSDAVSLQTIRDFLIKCKRNDVAFETLLEGKKLEAIKIIDAAYTEFKLAKNLVDIADIEKSVLAHWDDDFTKGYSEIFVDDFQIGSISFIKSKLQKQIFGKLSDYKKLLHVSQLKTPKIIAPASEVFNNIDEVKTAIKMARKLLQEGAESEEIIIVASDIQEYTPLYRLFLDEYEMKGFSSIGTPLTHFYNKNSPKVQVAYKTFTSQINTLEILFGKLGLVLLSSTKENIKASIKIQDEKIGIEMTEPNQLVGRSKSYKHIIFIGTDINHFPPKSSDNFLYGAEDDVKHFYANNYFLSSQTHYEELKRLGENLYLITAKYSGKRELTPSIIIDKKFDSTINVSDIQSINDLALHGRTTISQTQEYFESIVDEEFTKFDGKDVEGVDATHLSASQINKYLSCPLSYLYANKMKIKPPKQSQEGFDAMEQGSLMHLCFEYFGKHIKENHIHSTDADELCEIMYENSLKAYTDEQTMKNIESENIHHHIFLANLQAGLKDEREKGLLAKFVDYYIKYAEEFNYFQDTEFEKEFALDAQLKPYMLKDKEDQNYFIKGFIDRFDNLSSHINIIDYKSKKMSGAIDKAKQEQVENQKDIQLALYILYASQAYAYKEYNAHLLSFKGESNYYHFANLSTDEDLKNSIHYSDEYHENLVKLINDTKQNIENGEFGYDNSDEKTCGYCDIKFICHESILRKNKIEFKEESLG